MQDQNTKLMGDFPPVSYDEWRAKTEKDLKGADFEKLKSKTLDGFVIEPIYTAENAVSAEADSAAGLPPFRRGSHALGRSDGRWDMRQRHVHPDPAVVQKDASQDLGRGVSSLWLRLDRSARVGGTVAAGDGMLCPDVSALSEALRGVKLDEVAVSLDAGSNALPAAAILFAEAKQAGTPFATLHGALNGDPLGGLARDGEIPTSLDVSFEQLAALAQFCIARAPGVRAVGISIEPYHNSGASPAQEIGYALATGVAYLRKLTEAGLSVDEAASQITLTVAIGSEFFMEIAKLRALRQCWSSVMAACGASAETQRSIIQATTSSFTKTTRDPFVNMLRVTTESFAAAVGGVDALASEGYDAPFGPSDAFARRIASNAQVVLNEESHVAFVADPAGGSYFVESLTDTLVKEGYARFQAIEADGGMVEALKSGAIETQIASVRAVRDKAIARRKEAITGVSEFANLDEKPVLRRAINLQALSARLRLDAPEDVPLSTERTGAQLVEDVVEAASQGAAIATLTEALADGNMPEKFGKLTAHRKAEAFESLRDRADAHSTKTDKQPKAFLCNLGAIPKHKARASFASGLLNAGGIATVDNDGFSAPAAAVEAFKAADTQLAVVCGSDDQYVELLPEFLPALKAAGATYIVVAGRAGEHEDAFRKAGADDFIFMGCDVLATLETLLAQLGVA